MTKQLSSTPANYFGIRPVAGDVGIEIEVEGFDLPAEMGSYWSVHNDGSLRAPDGGTALEYVLSRPVKIDAVDKSLALFSKHMVTAKARSIDSPRTSVHVHFNYSQRTFQSIFTVACAHTIIEDLLVHYAGNDRVGNMFCLRAKDAEQWVEALCTAISNDSYQSLTRQDDLRYSALNLTALRKFGSIEFRALRGTTDVKVISDWVHLLHTFLTNVDKLYQNPQQIITSYSEHGAQEFVRRLVGDWYDKLLYPGWNDDLLDNMRLAQDIAYSIPAWPEKVEERKAAVVADDDGEDLEVREVIPRASQFINGRRMIANGTFVVNWRAIPENVNRVRIGDAVRERPQE